MPSRLNLNVKRRRRRSVGSQIVEFAAALTILVLVVFVPFLDLTILPVRWKLAQEIVDGYMRKLALCETFSESFRTVEQDPSLATKLVRLGGVSYESINLRMRISRIFNSPHPEESISIGKPGGIPPEWLPDGKKSPCMYSLELEVRTLISPAIMMPNRGVSIPGLTIPVPITIRASRTWENLGRNPVTRKFFLNE